MIIARDDLVRRFVKVIDYAIRLLYSPLRDTLTLIDAPLYAYFDPIDYRSERSYRLSYRGASIKVSVLYRGAASKVSVLVSRSRLL